jgi:catechol 2,3-dioxygenase-like lactoylglutathione lyase family enzyme
MTAGLRLGGIAIVVPDYDAAIRYFVEVLGFALVEDTRLDGQKRWVVVQPRGGGSALVLARAATGRQHTRIGDQTGGRVFLFLETDDFVRDHALLTARGVRFVEEPRVESYGIVAVFADFMGNRWDLIERRPYNAPNG